MLTEPKFKIGQSIFLGSDRRARIRDPYRITRVLPTEGGDQKYRVKSAREAHERVVLGGHLDEVPMAETECCPTEPNPPQHRREGRREGWTFSQTTDVRMPPRGSRWGEAAKQSFDTPMRPFGSSVPALASFRP
jgi:hypothetical protein